MRPNVLWYCTDQQRFDTIAALGNPYIHTPNLDRMVREGVSFENAYCQTPICTPSRATFLTGRYPATHHVHRNGAERFPEHEVLVTKLLSDSGYDCGLVGKLHLSRCEGTVEKRPKDDGYRYFKWSHHPTPDYPQGHDYANWLEEKGVDPSELYGGLSGAVGPGVPDELHQTTWCTEMALDFIRDSREGPWLLSVNPFDPHPPFDPPSKYLDRYDKDEMPFPLFWESDLEEQRRFEGIDQQTGTPVNPHKSGSKTHEPNSDLPRGNLGFTAPADYDAQLVRACYYAMVEKIDDSLGRIVKCLEETGQLDNTIIIFMSDHGELLGDHGLIYKGCRFFEGLVHVPLVVWWPGQSVRGKRSTALVELVDLPPTLLEVAGLEVPYYMQGTSLLPHIVGSAQGDSHKDYVVCEYNDAMDMPNRSHAFMYYDGRHKINIYQGHDVGEIFDLKEDPGEFNNLWGTNSGLQERLMTKAIHGYLATSSPGIRRTGIY